MKVSYRVHAISRMFERGIAEVLRSSEELCRAGTQIDVRRYAAAA